MADRLLELKGLKTHFFTDEGVVRAVDGVDLYINKGETLGVVGESGCGKTVTALSIMKLIPMPPVEEHVLVQQQGGFQRVEATDHPLPHVLLQPGPLLPGFRREQQGDGVDWPVGLHVSAPLLFNLLYFSRS